MKTTAAAVLLIAVGAATGIAAGYVLQQLVNLTAFIFGLFSHY